MMAFLGAGMSLGRGQRSHSASTRANKKRYLILTYAVEFDR